MEARLIARRASKALFDGVPSTTPARPCAREKPADTAWTSRHSQTTPHRPRLLIEGASSWMTYPCLEARHPLEVPSPPVAAAVHRPTRTASTPCRTSRLRLRSSCARDMAVEVPMPGSAGLHRSETTGLASIRHALATSPRPDPLWLSNRRSSGAVPVTPKARRDAVSGRTEGRPSDATVRELLRGIRRCRTHVITLLCDRSLQVLELMESIELHICSPGELHFGVIDHRGGGGGTRHELREQGKADGWDDQHRASFRPSGRRVIAGDMSMVGLPR